MASSESGILRQLTWLISTMVEMVLKILGLWGPAVGTATISVVVVWQIEVWWELHLPLVIDETRIGPEAAATLRTALGDLATRLQRVSEAGGGSTAIRAEAIRFQDRWTGWARKVAVTESTRIASEAVLASPAAGRSGAMKEWLTSHDEKVRTSHRLVDGVRAPISGSFMVGGGPLRFPGDPLGDPEQIINCRCGIRIVNGGSRS